MIQNLAFGEEQKLSATIDFVTCGATGLIDRRDPNDAKATVKASAVPGIEPAGRTINTGRDLLRSPFPIGWSNR